MENMFNIHVIYYNILKEADFMSWPVKLIFLSYTLGKVRFLKRKALTNFGYDHRPVF